MFRKVLFFGIVLFVGSSMSHSQKFVFKNFLKENGLSSNNLVDVLMDDNGYLWVASANAGVSKFNGSSFKNFNHKKGLSTNSINYLFKDSNNKIWIGTQNAGASYIDNEIIYNLESKFNDRCKSVKGFLERTNGNILILSSCGIFEYANDNIKKISTEGDKEFKLNLRKGAWLDDNTILVVTTNDGLHKITLSPYKSEKINVTPSINNISYTILKDSEDVFWIGTYGELVKYEPSKESIKKFKFNPNEFNSNRVKSIYNLNKAELLLGLEGNGMVIFNKQSGMFTVYNKKNGMPSQYIYGVTQDFEGNIWGADLHKGLISFRDRSTTYLDETSGTNTYREVIREGNDSVLVASSYGLLRLVNNVVRDTVIKNINVSTFCKIKKGEYLVSEYNKTKDNEFYRTYRYENFVKKELISKGMYGYIYADNNLTFLAGFGDYSIIKKDSTYKVRGPETAFLFKFGEGEYLLGAKGAALRFDEKRLYPLDNLYPDARNYFGYTQLSDGSIFTADNVDSLYNISYELGKYNVKSYSYKSFEIEEAVLGLASDSTALWIFSNKALQKIKISNLLNDEKIDVKNYPLDKVLLKNDISPSELRSVGDGVIYGITLDNLIIFDEKAVNINTKEPKLNLSSILLFAERFDETVFKKNDVIELPYNQNHLTFDMEAITYTYPENIKFKYRLKGLRNSKWSDKVKENKVVYSYLPPGNYSFEFLADNGNGVWSKKPFTYNFIIKLPFWRQPLFWIITIVGISGLTLLYVTRKNKIKAQQAQKFSQDLIQAQEEERTRISKDLHDSVGQQLTLIKKKAHHLNQKELSKMSNDALEEVRSISRDLYPATLKQLGFIQSVEQLVNNLDEGVDMFFTFEADEIDKDLDEEKSLNLYRFIQESLSNVIKHSDAKAVTVKIRKGINQIEAVVIDNGKGFNSAVVKNSLGLKTMAERIKMLKGTLSIKSRLNEGTTIIAQIPV